MTKCKVSVLLYLVIILLPSSSSLVPTRYCNCITVARVLNFTLGALLRSCNYCMVGEQVYILLKSSLGIQMHRYINCIIDLSGV